MGGLGYIYHDAGKCERGSFGGSNHSRICKNPAISPQRRSLTCLELGTSLD